MRMRMRRGRGAIEMRERRVVLNDEHTRDSDNGHHAGDLAGGSAASWDGGCSGGCGAGCLGGLDQGG